MNLRNMIPALALVCTTAMASPATEEPTFYKHYWTSLGLGAVGALTGCGLGIATSRGGNDDAQLMLPITMSFSGYVLGATYGANTITTTQEEKGSFGMDLLAASVIGLAGASLGYGVTSMSDGLEGWGTIGGFVLAAPLGAVWMQRAVVGMSYRTQKVTLWMPPTNDGHVALGLRTAWRLP